MKLAYVSQPTLLTFQKVFVFGLRDLCFRGHQRAHSTSSTPIDKQFPHQTIQSTRLPACSIPLHWRLGELGSHVRRHVHDNQGGEPKNQLAS